MSGFVDGWPTPAGASAELPVSDAPNVRAEQEQPQHRPQRQEAKARPSVSASGEYVARGSRTYRVQVYEREDGEPRVVETLLAHFAARVAADVLLDDGADEQRHLEIVAEVRGRPVTATVPAHAFARMEWVVPALGPAAIVVAGQGVTGHLRAAIQHLSGDVPRRRLHGQTGWREHEGRTVYLHAGGAIREGGPVDGVEVSLPPALAGYRLPAPPAGGELRESVGASLDLLSVGPDRLTVPLLAAAFRAPLGAVDFSVHLHGTSGVFKSELAGLIQAHWGAGFDGRHLPAAWSGTPGSVEEMAFRAADAVLSVDDFAPAGTTLDVDKIHSAADRLMRGVGNHAGRSRLTRDAQLRAPRPPRALVLSTGEAVPRGHSLQARMLALGVRPGDVDRQALTQAQGHAAAGRYAACMAAYLAWLAPRLDRLQATRGEHMAMLRSRASRGGQHARTPSLVASLAYGWDAFLLFATETGAVDRTEADALSRRGWRALGEAAAAASAGVGEQDPARRFLALLGSAIGSGQAHVAGPRGEAPAPEPAAWGWRRGLDGSWLSLGPRVGWTDGDDLWLDPDAAVNAARGAGEGLVVDAATLRQRLHEAGLLASVDTTRTPPLLTVRRRLDGRQRRALHLAADVLDDGAGPSHRAPGPGDSDVTQVTQGRVTPSHPRVTHVTHSDDDSDQHLCLSEGGESPESPTHTGSRGDPGAVTVHGGLDHTRTDEPEDLYAATAADWCVAGDSGDSTVDDVLVDPDENDWGAP